MNNKLITKIITFTCLIPITLVSVPFLVIGVFMWPIVTFEMGLSDIYESIMYPGKWSIGELVPTSVPLGIWGLITLWILAKHYIRHDYLPDRLVIISAGLVAGLLSSIQIMVGIFSQNRGGTWLGYILILSLIVAVYFGFILFTSNKTLKDRDALKRAP